MRHGFPVSKLPCARHACHFGPARCWCLGQKYAGSPVFGCSSVSDLVGPGKCAPSSLVNTRGSLMGIHGLACPCAKKLNHWSTSD